MRTVARNSWGNDAFRRDIPPPINGHSLFCTVITITHLFHARIEKLASIILPPWSPIFWHLRVQSDRNRSGFLLVEKSFIRHVLEREKWKSLAFTRIIVERGNKYYWNVLSATIYSIYRYRDLCIGCSWNLGTQPRGTARDSFENWRFFEKRDQFQGKFK